MSAANTGCTEDAIRRSIVKKSCVATTAIDTVPISQTAMQNMAQDRAVRISKLSPSNEPLRRQVEALGQFLFDRWPIALYRPVVVGKNLQNLDSDAGAIIRFEER